MTNWDFMAALIGLSLLSGVAGCTGGSDGGSGKAATPTASTPAAT